MCCFHCCRGCLRQIWVYANVDDRLRIEDGWTVLRRWRRVVLGYETGSSAPEVPLFRQVTFDCGRRGLSELYAGRLLRVAGCGELGGIRGTDETLMRNTKVMVIQLLMPNLP